MSTPSPTPTPSAAAASASSPGLIDRVYAILGGAGAGFGLVLVIMVAIFLVYRFLRGPPKKEDEDAAPAEGAKTPAKGKKGRGDEEEGLESARKRKGVRCAGEGRRRARGRRWRQRQAR